jgi:ferritin-like metal-binding protein YciE
MDENDLKRLIEASAAETQRRIEATAAETNKRIDAGLAATNERIDGLAQTNERIDAGLAVTNKRIDTIEVETRKLFAETQRLVSDTAADLRHHFDIVAEDMRNDVKLIAERVQMVDEKLEREAADIRAEMRQGFAATQVLLNVSYASLDRRVTALEER